MAKVTRKWINKKTGEVRIKSYDYTTKPKVNKVITKKGTISKRIESILSQIKSVQEREFVKAKIKQYASDMKSGDKKKTSYTLSTFRTMYEADRVRTFFDNMGVDIDEICIELNMNGVECSKEDILNNNNWDWKGNKDTDVVGSTLTLNNYKIQFTFQYLTHSYALEIIGHTEGE